MPTLTFTQTFTKLILGTNGTWQAAYWWADPTTQSYLDEEAAWMLDPTYGPTSTFTPFSVANGVLSITAGVTPQELRPVIDKPYVSGMLTTEGSFSQLYGFFEVTAKMAVGDGVKSDFWMLPADPKSTTTELDIFEVLGSQPSTINMTTHSDVTGVTELATTVPDAGTAFHKYGVYWTASTLTFYVDGKLTAQMQTPADMNRPMYLMLQQDVGTKESWEGAPTGTTLNTKFDISNVSVWADNPYAPPVPTASTVPPATLTLYLSASGAYPGTPFFMASVDGKAVLDTAIAVDTLHTVAEKTVVINKDFGPGQHTLTIQATSFDGSGGAVYLDGGSYMGVAFAAAPTPSQVTGAPVTMKFGT